MTEQEIRPFEQKIETRAIEARFYAHDKEAEPTFVLIDGIAYRREDDQERMVRFLQLEEARAKMQELLKQQEWALFRECEELAEEYENAEREAIEASLIQLLPIHELIIKHVFDPDNCPASGDEQVRHNHCILPPPTGADDC